VQQHGLDPRLCRVPALDRVEHAERAVGRLSHHLHDSSMVRTNPDVDYLRRAVAAEQAAREP
jgi:hypothetical protein